MFDLLVLGDAILLYAAVVTTAFAVAYSSFYNWRSTPAGRALLYFVCSLVIVFLNNAAARLLGPEYPAREWVRLAVYALSAAAATRLLWVLLRNWRRRESSALHLNPKVRKEDDMDGSRQDLILGTIRTAVPAAVGAFLAWLISRIPAVGDFIAWVDTEVLALVAPGVTVLAVLGALCIGLVSGAYFWAARRLGKKWPVVERWLLGSARRPAGYIDPTKEG
jgi:hypothetical protein